jgi:hypothetical protein
MRNRAGLDLHNYYPVQSGYGWLYQETATSSQGTQDSIDIEIVHHVAYQGVTVSRMVEGGGIDFPEELQHSFKDLVWDSDGLKLYRIVEKGSGPDEDLDLTFDPPELYFPASLELNQQRQTLFGTVTLKGVGESVTVPAGTFHDCIRISVLSEDGDCSASIYWLAPYVGIIKSQETCGEEVETSELVAARIDNQIIGSFPFCDGKVLSFAFSTIQENSASMLLDGIVIQGYQETFWAKFDFNPATLAFEVDWDHVGVGSADLKTIGGNQIPGLDFAKAEPYLWDCKNGFFQTAGIFDTVEYNGVTYFAEFVFQDDQLAFQLTGIWDQNRNLIWSLY